MQADLNRRAARHAQTHDEILDAAAELATARGVDALNLGELAARAGFGSAASLYRYFAGKDAIVAALAQRALKRLGAHMAQVPDDLPPTEQLVDLCLAYVDYAREHPGERRLLLTAAGAMAPADRAAIMPDQFVNRMFRLIHDAAADGALTARDEGDVFAVLHAAWALAQGWAEYDALYDDPEREILKSRQRAVFRALVEAFRRDWSAD
jgi:AcrR family transcriptional regulator